jgi:PAS domain-containing protein
MTLARHSFWMVLPLILRSRKQIEADLQSSEERLSRIITTISDALLVIDGEGMIKFVNPAAGKLFAQFSDRTLLGDHLGIPVITNEITEISLHHPTAEP